MKSNIQIHNAFKTGDLEVLTKIVSDISEFPNCHLPEAFGYCLEYAIYHSPPVFIKNLMEMHQIQITKVEISNLS